MILAFLDIVLSTVNCVTLLFTVLLLRKRSNSKIILQIMISFWFFFLNSVLPPQAGPVICLTLRFFTRLFFFTKDNNNSLNLILFYLQSTKSCLERPFLAHTASQAPDCTQHTTYERQTGNKNGLTVDENSGTRRGKWQVCWFAIWKYIYNFLALGFQDVQGRFLWERKGKVAEGLKTECRNSVGTKQRTVWYEESGGWEYRKQSGENGRVCKVEDGHTKIRQSNASDNI